MNFRLLKYFIAFSFILLKLSNSFALDEMRHKHFFLHETFHQIHENNQLSKHLVFHILNGSNRSSALFYEEFKEQEDLGEEDTAIEQTTSLLAKDTFQCFIPDADPDYLKPIVRNIPLGLKSNNPLFIVFRLIRI